jgi:hypothetical protein
LATVCDNFLLTFTLNVRLPSPSTIHWLGSLMVLLKD